MKLLITRGEKWETNDVKRKPLWSNGGQAKNHGQLLSRTTWTV